MVKKHIKVVTMSTGRHSMKDNNWRRVEEGVSIVYEKSSFYNYVHGVYEELCSRIKYRNIKGRVSTYSRSMMNFSQWNPKPIESLNTLEREVADALIARNINYLSSHGNTQKNSAECRGYYSID